MLPCAEREKVATLYEKYVDRKNFAMTAIFLTPNSRILSFKDLRIKHSYYIAIVGIRNIINVLCRYVPYICE